MDELSRSARALIDRVGPYDDPTGDDAQRVRQAVLVKVGAIGLGSAALAAGGAAQAKTAAAALLPKIGAAVVLFIGGAATIAYVARSPEPPPNAAVTAPISAQALPVAQPAAAAEPEPEALPSIVEPAPKARRTERAQAKPAAPVVETPEPRVPTTEAADLADEMRLIKSADAALRAGRNAEAQALLAQHERDHQKGTLSQEREGLRLLARCQSGGGVAEAQRFLAGAPKSPLGSRLKTACGLPK